MSGIIKETGGDVAFPVKVITRASKNEIVGVEGEAVKVRLNAPPVDGRANEALVKFLAARLGVARSSVEIISGHTSRKKVIRIRGVSAEQVQRAFFSISSGSGGP